MNWRLRAINACQLLMVLSDKSEVELLEAVFEVFERIGVFRMMEYGVFVNFSERATKPLWWFEVWLKPFSDVFSP